MKLPGHLGGSLLVYTPIGAALVAGGARELALAAAVSMLGLAMLPDVDERLPLVPHREPTHSLTFAAVVGVVFGVGAHLLPAAGSVTIWRALELGLPTVAFAIGFVTVLAHLLCDALTPAGVAFLWPLSTRRFALPVAGAGNPLANYLLLGLGLLAFFLVGRVLGLA